MCPALLRCSLSSAVADMDPEILRLKLAYHEAMVERLQDHKPEIALIWLSGAELLRKRLQSMGINPDEPVVGQRN